MRGDNKEGKEENDRMIKIEVRLKPRRCKMILQIGWRQRDELIVPKEMRGTEGRVSATSR